MKGIFITYCMPSDYDNTGIGLKIRNQICAFQQHSIDFSEYTLPYSSHPMLRILYRLPFYNGYPKWKYDKIMSEADCIYFRRPFVMTGYMRRTLIQIRREKPDIKVVMELPTYPYDKEIAFYKLSWLFLVRDRYNRNKLSGIVDRIATLSQDDSIFGIDTIKIKNGIDVKAIKERVPIQREEDEIHIGAVAIFQKWHAYERLLLGMAKYYLNNRTKKVIFHLAGEGTELPLYKKIVKEKGLEQYVVFHGYLEEDALDKFYDIIDIGISSLGCHRAGIYGCVSVLKSREYLSKGLPIISSTPIDVLEEADFPYKLYIPQDESTVLIDKVVEFYENILKSEPVEVFAKKIRKYALEHVDMKKTMEPVVDFFKNSN